VSKQPKPAKKCIQDKPSSDRYNLRGMEGFVVVRHTRGGDEYCGFWNTEEYAMDSAQRIVDEAAYAYGSAYVSVFKATIKFQGKAIQPKGST